MPPQDELAQYAAKSPSAVVAAPDELAQYARKSSSAASPLAPPSLPSPRDAVKPIASSMHPSFLIGDPDKDSTPPSLGDVAKGALRNAYQVSAPGIASSILHKTNPGLVSRIPVAGEAMEESATPIRHLPNQLAENFTLGADPEAEAGETGAAASTEKPAPSIARPGVPAPDSPPGMMGRVGEVAVRRAGKIPGVQAVKDADYILRGPRETPPIAAPAPKPIPASIPETNGIPWGSGGKGPIALRGQRIPFSDPGAPLPEDPGVFSGAPEPKIPAPEVLQANSLLRGPQRIADPAAGLGEIPQPGRAGQLVESVQARPAPPSGDSFLDRLRAKAARIESGGHGEETPEPEETPETGPSLKINGKPVPADIDLEAAGKASVRKVKAAKRSAARAN